MTEAGSALPSRPMLVASSCGSAPYWIRQEITTQASASSASRLEQLRAPLGEHLAGAAIRVEPDRYGEPLTSVFEFDRFGGATIRKAHPAIILLRGFSMTRRQASASHPCRLGPRDPKSRRHAPDPSLPVLAGIVTTPVFGRNGELITEPGRRCCPVASEFAMTFGVRKFLREIPVKTLKAYFESKSAAVPPEWWKHKELKLVSELADYLISGTGQIGAGILAEMVRIRTRKAGHRIRLARSRLPAASSRER